MKQILLISILSFLFICCKSDKKDKNTIETFIFSNAGLYYDYSLKFDSSDTVYFEQRFPSRTKNYYTILKPNEKDSIFKLIGKIDFTNYLSRYSDNNLADGAAYRFLVVKNKKIDSVFIYGKKGPIVFYKIASALKAFKKKKRFFELNKNIDFENLNYKMLPPPPPPAPEIEKFIISNKNTK